MTDILADGSAPSSPDPNTQPGAPGAPSVPGSPSVPNVAAAAIGGTPPNVPPPAPALAPQPQVDPVKEHHSAIGRALSHVAASIEGKQISYQADPDNPGQIRQIVQPRKAGSIFRDILLGSIAGGAIGAAAPNRESMLGGAALGAQAGLSAQEAGQDKRKQVAQQSANEYKTNQDRIYQQSQVALHNISNLVLDHHADLHDPSKLSSYNSSQDLVKKLALENGATTPQIVVNGKDVNGQLDNGGPLLETFQRDPQSVMKAPDGFHRVALQNIDTSGLTFKPGVGYVDDKGQRVDLADRTTFSLVDIPAAKWGATISLSAKQINDVAHGTAIIDPKNPDRKMSTTFGSILGLSLKSIKDLNDAHAELHAPPKDENEAMSFKAFADTTKGDPNATPEDRQRAEIKGRMAESFLQSKEDSQKDKPLTPEQDKLKTRNLEKQLADGTISSDDRKDLVARQQEAKVTGVDSGIQSQVQPPPVPAQYPKGKDDPAFKAADVAWGKHVTKLQTAKNTAGVQIRMQAFEDVPYNVITTNPDGSSHMDVMTRGELAAANKQNPGKYLLATQDGLKVKSKEASIADIKYNIDNSEKAIAALDDIDTSTRAKLAVALRSSDPHSALATLAIGEAKTFSDPKLQDTMIALTSMAENVMVLRSVQGVGQGGSDLMRHALMDLIPSATSPSKGYALKQLKVFRGTLDRLEKGVPKTGVQPPGGGGNPQGGPPTPGPPTPTSHVFNVSVWQKANPSGDRNAAIAAAKAKGFQVVQ